jgi:hypothetical protein
MGNHPNVILAVAISPQGLSRKTMAALKEDAGVNYSEADEQFTIEGKEYHCVVMEGDYDDSFQVKAKEGDLVFLDMVTYGYGDVIDWLNLANQAESLEAWAKAVCEKHHCDYRIFVTANYW